LALAEAHQHQKRWRDAATCLKRLQSLNPDAMIVTLSLAELLVEDVGDKPACKQVVALTAEVRNESDVHAATLLYKAKALSTLGLHTAARDVLTAALRRKRGRSAELLRVLRYERGRVYESLGQHRRARSEFEKIYAECPTYEDVESRLMT
jgi:tetratricopeptide (TPR) repeat protein